MSDAETIATLNARITRLEELVSHQQHLLAQLDEVVTQQNVSFEKQRREFQTEMERLRYQVENTKGGDLPHEKPPHY